MAYVIVYQGTGNGVVDVTPTTVSDTNREIERKEIEHLRTHPDKAFLYVRKVDTTDEVYNKALIQREKDGWPSHLPDRRQDYISHRWEVTTWLGTSVCTYVYVGPVRSFRCFGPFPSKRRAVTCYMFGKVYYGWYFESSGNYCRLRLAKRQPKWAKD